MRVFEVWIPDTNVVEVFAKSEDSAREAVRTLLNRERLPKGTEVCDVTNTTEWN